MSGRNQWLYCFWENNETLDVISGSVFPQTCSAHLRVCFCVHNRLLLSEWQTGGGPKSCTFLLQRLSAGVCVCICRLTWWLQAWHALALQCHQNSHSTSKLRTGWRSVGMGRSSKRCWVIQHTVESSHKTRQKQKDVCVCSSSLFHPWSCWEISTSVNHLCCHGKNWHFKPSYQFNNHPAVAFCQLFTSSAKQRVIFWNPGRSCGVLPSPRFCFRLSSALTFFTSQAIWIQTQCLLPDYCWWRWTLRAAGAPLGGPAFLDRKKKKNDRKKTGQRPDCCIWWFWSKFKMALWRDCWSGATQWQFSGKKPTKKICVFFCFFF